MRRVGRRNPVVLEWGTIEPKPHPCKDCKHDDLRFCPFRRPGTYSQVCDVCKLPIMKDENWQANGKQYVHYRCRLGVARPRPEWMDELCCLDGTGEGENEGEL